MSDQVFESLWDIAQGRQSVVAKRLARLAYEQARAKVAEMAQRSQVIDGQFRELPAQDVDQSARADKAQKLVAQLDRAETFLVTILGRPGTGKTALGCKIIDRRHTELHRRCYALGINARALAQAGVSDWMQPIGDLAEIPDNVDVLVDDASLVIGNRGYDTPQGKAFLELVEIRRHRGIGMIINCQEGSAINRYAFSADVVFLKPSASFFPELDRQGLRTFLAKADDAFKTLPEDQVKYHVMTLARWPFPSFEDLLAYTYPSWYTEEFSKNKRQDL